jgi:hypothetical protein
MMTVFRRLVSIASWILRRDRAEQQLDDEIRSFVEMSTADRVLEGVPPAEAPPRTRRDRRRRADERERSRGPSRRAPR